MRVDRCFPALLLCLAATIALTACAGAPAPQPVGGECCLYTGPLPHDCAAIEALGPGADLDGRCNQVNGGQSCAWNYAEEACCEKAIADGYGDVTSCDPDGRSGDCCIYTGPVARDCAAIETLGPGADLDGRCNQVNQGQSCSWLYSEPACCDKAVGDGFPHGVVCP